jgi:hypothetical protein
MQSIVHEEMKKKKWLGKWLGKQKAKNRLKDPTLIR